MFSTLVSIVKRVFLKHTRLYLTMIVLGVSVAVLEFGFLAVVLPFFNFLLNPNATLPSLLVKVTDAASVWLPLGTTRLLIIFLIVLAFLKAGASLFYFYLVGYSSGVVQEDLKAQMIRRYETLPFEIFLSQKQGDLIYRTLQAPSRASLIFIQGPSVIVEIMRTLAIGFFIAFVNLKLLAFVVGISVLVFIVAELISKNVSYNLGKGRMVAATTQSSVFSEFLTGLKQIKIFGRSFFWTDRFNDMSRQYTRFFSRDYIWATAPKHVIEFVAFFVLLLVAFFLYGRDSSSFQQQIPVLGALGLAMIKLLPSLNVIGKVRVELTSAIPDVQAIFDTIDMKTRTEWEGTRPFNGFKDKIHFDGVVFSHPDRLPVLQGVNCEIPKNKTTAVVGRSGSGKTTLLNLLLGVYRPDSGEIKVDGENLSDLDINQWREKIGFVSQDPFIFHASVRENICMGDETFSDERIMEAARLANALDFINDLPDKLDTIVGEKGMKLSGGQQQRLCIARALLRRPDVIVFDEATSSLDHTSEKLIQKTIRDLAKEFTVLIVAHRMTTIQEADQILFLEEGKIAERGTYEQLNSKGTHFSSLFETKEEKANKLA